MHADPAVVTWPDYQEFYRWMCDETEGLTEVQLDFDSQDPAQTWMEWSIRRQVSHITWVMLSVMHGRFQPFLWPDGRVPTPIRWEDHRMPHMKSDRRLDESVHWELDNILEKAKLAVDWATQVVATVPIETLRGTERAYTATDFWLHVLPVIPRGAWIDADNPHRIHFTLEASLWMMYWESLVHLYTVQRLKRAQGLSTRVAIPSVGYLTLPEYTGEAQVAAPYPVPLR
jgi:hypothetical protein